MLSTVLGWLGAQLWALTAWLWAQLWTLARTGWKAFYRWYVGLTRKARIRFAIAAWVFVLTAPIWLINTAVAYYGHTVVFPLSPFFLREKLHALASYAAHRPFCAFMGHADIGPLIAEAEVKQRLPRGLLAAIVQVESVGQAPPHLAGRGDGPGPADARHRPHAGRVRPVRHRGQHRRGGAPGGQPPGPLPPPPAAGHRRLPRRPGGRARPRPPERPDPRLRRQGHAHLRRPAPREPPARKRKPAQAIAPVTASGTRRAGPRSARWGRPGGTTWPGTGTGRPDCSAGPL